MKIIYSSQLRSGYGSILVVFILGAISFFTKANTVINTIIMVKLESNN